MENDLMVRLATVAEDLEDLCCQMAVELAEDDPRALAAIVSAYLLRKWVLPADLGILVSYEDPDLAGPELADLLDRANRLFL